MRGFTARFAHLDFDIQKSAVLSLADFFELKIPGTPIEIRNLGESIDVFLRNELKKDEPEPSEVSEKPSARPEQTDQVGQSPTSISPEESKKRCQNFKQERQQRINRLKSYFSKQGQALGDHFITNVIWILEADKNLRGSLLFAGPKDELWRFPLKSWAIDPIKFIRNLSVVINSQSVVINSQNEAPQTIDALPWIHDLKELNAIIKKVTGQSLKDDLPQSDLEIQQLQSKYRESLKLGGIKRVEHVRFPTNRELNQLLVALLEIGRDVTGPIPEDSLYFVVDEHGKILENEYGIKELNQNTIQISLSRRAECSRSVAQFFLRSVARGCRPESFDLDLLFTSLTDVYMGYETMEVGISRLRKFFESGVEISLHEKVGLDEIENFKEAMAAAYTHAPELTVTPRSKMVDFLIQMEDLDKFVKSEAEKQLEVKDRYLINSKELFKETRYIEAVETISADLGGIDAETLSASLKPEIIDFIVESISDDSAEPVESTPETP